MGGLERRFSLIQIQYPPFHFNPPLCKQALSVFGYASRIILFVYAGVQKLYSCLVEMHACYLLLFWLDAEQTFADKICAELLQRYFPYIIASLCLQSIVDIFLLDTEQKFAYEMVRAELFQRYLRSLLLQQAYIKYKNRYLYMVNCLIMDLCRRQTSYICKLQLKSSSFSGTNCLKCLSCSSSIFVNKPVAPCGRWNLTSIHQ